MKRILSLITVTLLLAGTAIAQPTKTRVPKQDAPGQAAGQAGKSSATDRAALMLSLIHI